MLKWKKRFFVMRNLKNSHDFTLWPLLHGSPSLAMQMMRKRVMVAPWRWWSEVAEGWQWKPLQSSSTICWPNWTSCSKLLPFLSTTLWGLVKLWFPWHSESSEWGLFLLEDSIGWWDSLEEALYPRIWTAIVLFGRKDDNFNASRDAQSALLPPYPRLVFFKF